MLRAKCDVCGKTTKGGDDWAGRVARCPNCDAEIVFPSEQPAVEAGSFSPAEAGGFDHSLGTEFQQSSFLPPPVVERDYAAKSTAPQVGSRNGPEFRALGTLATCYEMLAWLVALLGALGVLAEIVSLVKRPELTVQAIAGIITIVVSAGMATLACLAISQFIHLMIQMERNTRETRDNMTDLVVALQTDK